MLQGGSAEPRLWFLSLVAGERYPDVPPTIRFTSRVNLECVDGSGVVSVPCLAYERVLASVIGNTPMLG